MKTGRNPRLKRAVRILAPVMILLVLILHGVSSGAILNPPRPPELSGNIPLPSITLGLGQADSPRDVALTLQILALMTVLSLVPAILYNYRHRIRSKGYRSTAVAASAGYSGAFVVPHNVHDVSDLVSGLRERTQPVSFRQYHGSTGLGKVNRTREKFHVPLHPSGRIVPHNLNGRC